MVVEDDKSVDDDDEDIEIVDDDEVEVEVVDKTPDKDKGKWVAKDDDPPEDLDDDELSEYSERVQKRIKGLYARSQAERRRADSVKRQLDAAIGMSQRLQRQFEEANRRLSEVTNSGTQTKREMLTSKIQTLADQHRRAFEDGDSEQITKLQTEMARANAELVALGEERKAPERQAEQPTNQSAPQQPRQQRRPPQPDPRMQAWSKKNPWFGQDQVMTGAAYGIHTEIVNEGFDPNSDEYYNEIDTRMREAFPHKFKRSTGGGDKDPPPRKNGASVVAPAARTAAKNPRRVVLTVEEKALANRLGVPLEEYAKEKARMERTQ